MSVAEIFALHVSAALSAYRGNFRSLEKVVDAGDVPEVDDPTVRAYVEQLRRYLSKNGAPESDEFLLRFGLAAPGALRGIHPAILALSPERGGFSDKRLQQATGQISRIREALKLGYRFFPELSRDTKTALRQLSAYAFSPAVPDGEWVGLHADLSSAEAEELANRAFDCFTDSDRNIREVGTSLLALANFREPGLGDKIQRLAENDIFWPPSLYSGAPVHVADMLISLINAAAKRLPLNQLLLALAWTRSEAARRAFLDWKNSPPPWSIEILAPAERYAHEAGWELDTDGSRRDLISFSCHRIVKKADRADGNFSIPCRMPTGGTCPACGGALGWLFDFSGLPVSHFSEERADAPRKLLYCPNCACFGPVFSKYTLDGKAEWRSATNCSEGALVETWAPCLCHLSPTPFPPFASAEPFELKDTSTLGGVPMWLQDAEYPNCPDCGKTMRFLAQFDNLAMEKPEEGLYYAFFCGACQVSAVTYQQT